MTKLETSEHAAASSVVSSAVHLLHRAGQCADEVFSICLADSSMTPRQYAVLKAVEVSVDPSQTTLVDITGIDRSTTADIVRRLVERGYVQRRRRGVTPGCMRCV